LSKGRKDSFTRHSENAYVTDHKQATPPHITTIAVMILAAAAGTAALTTP
jgi:hypothetical protein